MDSLTVLKMHTYKVENWKLHLQSVVKCANMYRTRATINRGYYYFFLKSYVGFSLMIGGIPLKMCGYKTSAVINRARLMVARVRYRLIK